MPSLPSIHAPVDASIKHSDSIAYWDSIPSDVNGMLGGYPHVSRVDIQGSRAFLVKCGISASKPVLSAKRTLRGEAKKVDEEAEKAEEKEAKKEEKEAKKEAKPLVEEKRLRRVADCGAGIGRITKDLLLSLSTTVDIVEPISKFTASLAGVPGIGDIYNVGLESWEPRQGIEYDLIWNQWCVGHLTDAQLVVYLKKCGSVLRKDEGKVTGMVVVKENLAPVMDNFDEEDSSVTRTEEKFKAIFKEAGLRILRTELQKGFPKELYDVRIWALQPEVSAPVAVAA